MNDLKFETLLLEKNLKYKDKWSPTTVSSYSNYLKEGILEDMSNDLRKNIAYSMQYLEYIDFQLRELKLHSIISKMLYKTFIITTISIVEAIFYYILKSNGKHKTITEELIFTSRSNKKRLNNDEIIVETNFFKVIEPKEYEMSFDIMIKKMEKGKYLDLKHEYFPYLKHFKNLRNRVHIHISDKDGSETDFWKFERADFLFVKYMLFKLLTDEKILKITFDDKPGKKFYPRAYSFLTLNKDEQEIVTNKYKNKEE